MCREKQMGQVGWSRHLGVLTTIPPELKTPSHTLRPRSRTESEPRMPTRSRYLSSEQKKKRVVRRSTRRACPDRRRREVKKGRRRSRQRRPRRNRRRCGRRPTVQSPRLPRGIARIRHPRNQRSRSMGRDLGQTVAVRRRGGPRGSRSRHCPNYYHPCTPRCSTKSSRRRRSRKRSQLRSRQSWRRRTTKRPRRKGRNRSRYRHSFLPRCRRSSRKHLRSGSGGSWLPRVCLASRRAMPRTHPVARGRRLCLPRRRTRTRRKSLPVLRGS